MRRVVGVLVAMGVVVVLGACDLGTLVTGADGGNGDDGDDGGLILADVYEPDNTRDAATALPVSPDETSPVYRTHTLHTDSDRDWFELDVTNNNGYLGVDLSPIFGGEGVGNIDLILYDSAGTEISRSTSPFENSTEGFIYTDPFETGTYYVEVFATDSDTGDYQIAWYVYSL